MIYTTIAIAFALLSLFDMYVGGINYLQYLILAVLFSISEKLVRGEVAK